MIPLAGAALGAGLALAIHPAAWRLRRRRPRLAAVLGGGGALLLTLAGLAMASSPYLGEIGRELRIALGLLWATAALVGLLQARAVPAHPAAAALMVFVEAALALAAAWGAAAVRDRLVVGLPPERQQALHDGYQWLVYALVAGLLLLALARSFSRRPGG